MIFKGSMVALVTPFGADGKIDFAALEKLVHFHLENGTHVLVPCGTTGESATLSYEEQISVVKFVKKTAGGKVKILAGAGANSTSEAIELHRGMTELGVDGALHVTPYYNKPTQAGLVAHFRALAESSALPIVLYNVPGRTCVNMLPETTLRLAEIPNIVGIKEASGSVEQISEVLVGAPENFAVYAGDDALAFPLYALGAHGVISVSANVAPREVAGQYEAFVRGDIKTARELHFQLMPLNSVLFVETNPIPVKAALALMGRLEEIYRLPLVPLKAENRERLKSVLKKLNKVF